MDENKLAELESANTSLKAEIARLTGEVAAAADKAVEQDAIIAGLNTTIESLNTKVTEAEVARDSAITERDAAAGKVTELETQVAELTAFKAGVETKELEAANEAKLASRKAQLPKSYLAAFEAKPEERRKMLEEKWMAMSDEQFAIYLEDELGYKPDTRISFFERSQREGILPVGGESTEGAEDIKARVFRLLGRNS